MIDWPENILPCPDADYGSNVDGKLLVQEMEIGTRQRRRFSDDNEKISVRWKFNKFQWAYFRNFVAITLSHGAASTNMTVLTVNGLERVTVKLIGGKYSSKYTNFENYEVSANLELIGPPKAQEDLFALQGILENEENMDEWFAFSEELTTITESRNIIP